MRMRFYSNFFKRFFFCILKNNIDISNRSLSMYLLVCGSDMSLMLKLDCDAQSFQKIFRNNKTTKLFEIHTNLR